MAQKSIKTRIAQLIEELTAGLYEREEIIAVSFLAALAGQNSFLLGPPGTAKSLISRRIACAFQDPSYFECLMNRFSTPEEVFGPISIKELKEDRYQRKTDGYLPASDFAFLDEIWKSSPAILNTLLTLINERTFRNGDEIQNAPLKALISASNEVPPEGQGLEAIYDRFLVRILVPSLLEKENFDNLISGKPTPAKIELKSGLAISQDEWTEWQASALAVEISKETIQIITEIRLKLEALDEENQVYVSDRRWQRAAMLMKTAAFFCGRKTTNHSDALLLRHCLWSNDDNRDSVVQIVEEAVCSCGLSIDSELAALDQQKDDLDREINEELFHSDDIYKTVTLADGEEYFYLKFETPHGYNYRSSSRHIFFYVARGRFNTNGEFHGLDRNGKEQTEIVCDFEGQGSCRIKYENVEIKPGYTPTVLFHKGDRKEDVNERLVKELKRAALDLRNQIQAVLNSVESRKAAYLKSLKSPFVPTSKTELATESVTQQCSDLELRIKDCERLIELCGENSSSSSLSAKRSLYASL